MAWRTGRHVYWILIWNCLLWCWAMYSGKSYGCHLYGMKNRKACVLDIDMELPFVVSCKVLCRYVYIVSSVWYLSILCTFCIFVINNSHVPNPWHNLRTYSIQQSPSWEANQFSASQEIPCILWSWIVHYRIHKPPWHNSKHKLKPNCASQSCYRTTVGQD